MRLTVWMLLLLLVPWVALCVSLLATKSGRTYLKSLGEDAAIKEAMAVRRWG